MLVVTRIMQYPRIAFVAVLPSNAHGPNDTKPPFSTKRIAVQAIFRSYERFLYHPPTVSYPEKKITATLEKYGFIIVG